MENANLLQVPGYGLLNVNVHYGDERPYLRAPTISSKLRTCSNKTYIASANNITDNGPYRITAASRRDGNGIDLRRRSAALWRG